MKYYQFHHSNFVTSQNDGNLSIPIISSDGNFSIPIITRWNFCIPILIQFPFLSLLEMETFPCLSYEMESFPRLSFYEIELFPSYHCLMEITSFLSLIVYTVLRSFSIHCIEHDKCCAVELICTSDALSYTVHHSYHRSHQSTNVLVMNCHI